MLISVLNTLTRQEADWQKIASRLDFLTSNLFDESKTKNDIEELREKISYLRIQFVYQSGREPAVEDFVKKAGLLEALKEIQDIPSLQRFCRYMEALIAYFKFNGGREQ